MIRNKDFLSSVSEALGCDNNVVADLGKLWEKFFYSHVPGFC